MHDTGFQIVFWLIFGIVVLGFAITFVGAIVHFAIFGTVAGLIAKRIGAMHARQSRSRMNRECAHCRSVVVAGAVECPNCGAPQS